MKIDNKMKILKHRTVFFDRKSTVKLMYVIDLWSNVVQRNFRVTFHIVFSFE